MGGVDTGCSEKYAENDSRVQNLEKDTNNASGENLEYRKRRDKRSNG